jgi:hypothetical protein
MFLRLTRSRITLLVLVLVLVAPWASASQPRGRHAERSPERASISVPWNLLEILRGFFSDSWSKNGCSADPFGKPVCQQAPEANPPNQQDAGCQVDPNGGCVSGR